MGRPSKGSVGFKYAQETEEGEGACVSHPDSSALEMEQAVWGENSPGSCDFLCALDVVGRRMRRLVFRARSLPQ